MIDKKTELDYLIYIFEFPTNKKESITEKEIKEKYKELIKKYHPDLNPTMREWAEEKTKKINQIYPLLLEYAKKIQQKKKTLKKHTENGGKTFPRIDLPPPTNDYNLYKRGFLLANWAFTIYYEEKMKREKLPKELVITIKNTLIRAKSEFAMLIKKYPNSKWSIDAIEKIDKINLWLEKI